MSGLLDSLRHLMREDGDCLLWRAGTTGTGHPMWRFDGRNRLVRRALWEAEHGPIPADRVLRVTCGQQRCCNPEHVRLLTRQQVAAECGRLGLMSDPIRTAHIALAKRAGPTAKLNDRLVREIRASSETVTQLARRMGVNVKLVSQVRRGERWREYSSGPMAWMTEVLR